MNEYIVIFENDGGLFSGAVRSGSTPLPGDYRNDIEVINDSGEKLIMQGDLIEVFDKD